MMAFCWHRPWYEANEPFAANQGIHQSKTLYLAPCASFIIQTHNKESTISIYRDNQLANINDVVLKIKKVLPKK